MQPSPDQTVVIRIRLWRGGACCSHSSQPVGANRTLCCLQSTMSGHQVSIQSHGDGMRRRDDTLTLSAECPAACECLLPSLQTAKSQSDGRAQCSGRTVQWPPLPLQTDRRLARDAAEQSQCLQQEPGHAARPCSARVGIQTSRKFL